MVPWFSLSAPLSHATKAPEREGAQSNQMGRVAYGKSGGWHVKVSRAERENGSGDEPSQPSPDPGAEYHVGKQTEKMLCSIQLLT
jgi:hypothetical protein